MYPLQPAVVDQSAPADTVDTAFYIAAHRRLSASLGDEARQVALDTMIDLYRTRG